MATVLKPGTGFLYNTEDPAKLPAWVDDDDPACAVSVFQRTGFRRGLNGYRALRSGPELLAPGRGAPIRQPSLFSADDCDDVLKFSDSAAALARFDRNLLGLRGSAVLAGAGTGCSASAGLRSTRC